MKIHQNFWPVVVIVGGVFGLVLCCIDGIRLPMVRAATARKDINAMLPRDGRDTPIMAANGLVFADATINTVSTTISAGAPAATFTTNTVITPAAMSGIVYGAMLMIGSGTGREAVMVMAVTGTTFTASFIKSHVNGETITGSAIVSPILFTSTTVNAMNPPFTLNVPVTAFSCIIHCGSVSGGAYLGNANPTNGANGMSWGSTAAGVPLRYAATPGTIDMSGLAANTGGYKRGEAGADIVIPCSGVTQIFIQPEMVGAAGNTTYIDFEFEVGG